MFARLTGALRWFAPPAAPPAAPSAVVPDPPFDPARVSVERYPVPLADLSREELRALITALDARSERVGCAVFGKGPEFDRAVVIFAGNLERFHMLAAARHLRCPVVYVQDVKSWWYQGSDVLPDLRAFCLGFLAPEVGPVPVLFFGQSAGAYAALAASAYFTGSTVVACAPQTFPDAAAKRKIHFVGVRALSVPDDILDLREHLSRRPDPTAARTLVIAAGETGNPASAHYWMDYLHVLHIADLDGMGVAIVNADAHPVVHGRVNLFADHLKDLAADLSATVEARQAMTRDFLTRAFAAA